MTPVIQVKNLGKKYSIRHEHPERYTALRDVVAQQIKKIFSFPKHLRTMPPVVDYEEFWALRGVSFDIQAGDRVGIIGRNGAGKSTLLKILSRITEPSTGRVELNGRVASLLEVGTGFHPELSGRENIFLNGAILGMSQSEVKRKFDEIVDFSGVEQFLDTPVKRYSSGMYVRLAFAVAAHLEPEILIVDEVLAVGDAEFQKKCLGKMEEVSRGDGRTILFVSHHLPVIQSLCSVGIYLSGGCTKFIGDVEETIKTYLNDSEQQEAKAEVNFFGEILIQKLSVSPASLQCGSDFTLDLHITAIQDSLIIGAAILLYNDAGLRVGIIDLRGQWGGKRMPAGTNETIRIKVTEANLVEGRYSMGLYIQTARHAGDLYNLATANIEMPSTTARLAPYEARHRGIVHFKFDFI